MKNKFLFSLALALLITSKNATADSTVTAALPLTKIGSTTPEPSIPNTIAAPTPPTTATQAPELKAEITQNEATAQAATGSDQVVTRPKKKKFNFWGLFDFIGKFEKYFQSKSDQNGQAIADAEQGIFKTNKRKIATDPAARKVQEKLDKSQAELLNKYDKVE